MLSRTFGGPSYASTCLLALALVASSPLAYGRGDEPPTGSVVTPAPPASTVAPPEAGTAPAAAPAPVPTTDELLRRLRDQETRITAWYCEFTTRWVDGPPSPEIRESDRFWVIAQGECYLLRMNANADGTAMGFPCIWASFDGKVGRKVGVDVQHPSFIDAIYEEPTCEEMNVFPDVRHYSIHRLVGTRLSLADQLAVNAVVLGAEQMQNANCLHLRSEGLPQGAQKDAGFVLDVWLDQERNLAPRRAIYRGPNHSLDEAGSSQAPGSYVVEIESLQAISLGPDLPNCWMPRRCLMTGLGKSLKKEFDVVRLNHPVAEDTFVPLPQIGTHLVKLSEGGLRESSTFGGEAGKQRRQQLGRP